MSFLTISKTLPVRRIILFLIPAMVVYFVAIRLFHDAQVYHNFDMIDAYPGLPILPEPYEIPLYLFGYIVIPILAILAAYLWSYRIVRFLAIFAIFLGVVAAIFGILWVGFPGLSGIWQRGVEYLERRSIWDFFWLIFTKRLYVVRIAFLATLVAAAIAWLIRPQTAWVLRFEKFLQRRRIGLYLIIGLAVLLFHPNFPYQEGFTNFIVQPANEILHGKRLLYETTSIYGILHIYLLAFVFKIFGVVSYEAFALFLMGYYFLFYAALYKLLNLWMDSKLFALFGTALGIIAGFFLLTDPHITAYTFPGQSAFRQGFYIFTALLLAFFVRNPNPKLKQAVLAAAGVSLFWNIDTGLYLSAAVALTMAYQEWNFGARFWQNIKRLIVLGINHAAYIAAVFGLISGINYLIFREFPNWYLELADISTFNAGYGKFPMPKFGLFELHVFVYLAYAIYVARKFLDGAKVHLLVVFFTVYGIFSFFYYVGNSVWSYLHMVSIPMLLLVWHYLYNRIRESSGEISRALSAAVYGLAAFAVVLSLAKLPTVFAYRDYTNISMNRIAAREQSLYEDAQFIKANLPGDRIALFHEQDGRLLSWTGKINYLYLQSGDERLYSLYDDYLVIYRRHVQGLINQIKTGQPEYVVISKSPDPRFIDFDNFVKSNYDLDKSLNTLNIYKLR